MAPRFVVLPEFRRAAKAMLPREVFNFGDGGSETELIGRISPHRHHGRLGPVGVRNEQADEKDKRGRRHHEP